VLGNDMGHVNKSKNNNSIVRAATFLTLATMTVILVVGTAVIVVPFSLQSAEAQRFIDSESNFAVERKPPAAPVVVSGDNIYVAWWTNNTENGNEEVMFRASNDGGATFGDKMNLSNTPDADSGRVEIAAEGADVIVTWWETNQTSDTPVARISTDGGQTFGPMLRLAANGTISPETTTTTTNDEEATTSVSIVRGSSELTDDAYQPNPIEVSIDDTITWTNDDIAQHTVTSGENGEPNGEFDSGLLSTGATFEHTFTEAGEYPYFCTLHPNMVGTVIVS
jgi:plastocyanin